MLLTVAFSVPARGAGQSRRPPNVVVIVADDLGYGDLGIHGCKDIPTPHIDSLARNGVRCSNGYVSHPYCSPTRAGLLTGRYQQRFGHEFNPGPPTDRTPGLGLPPSETTFADRLKAAGYRTGVIGKWHLGHVDDNFHPLNRGFDEFFGFLGGSHSYFHSGSGNISIRRNRQEVHEADYLTDALGREGAAFIERHAQEPFFLYWAFNAVHGPMEATAEDLESFKAIEDETRRTYAGMLASLDDAVGQGLEALRAAGIEKDTLIFFISDNGGPESVNASDNGELRGSKGSTYEGGIRVPFLVQWIGRLPEGRVYEEPVIQLDILPTAMAAAGSPVGEEAGLDGVDLLPYLEGAAGGAPHELLFWRDGGGMAVRQGAWKLVKSPAADRRRTKQAAATASAEGAELYRLADDVAEAHDLAASHPEQVQQLAAAWESWNAELIEPLWETPPRGKRRRAARE
jgi:arylsulfatase A-like enzyme